MSAAGVTGAAGAAGPGAGALLSVRDLSVSFHTDTGVVRAVDGVSWSVAAGETLGVVGESGSGKSVSAMAVMGLLASPPARVAGRVTFARPGGSGASPGEIELLGLADSELRAIRGKEISMIFQDPLSALNPVLRVGRQVAEVISAHERIGRVPARRRAVQLLADVGIPDAADRADAFPHQFSGGMRQRAMIAMALALDPAVLFADEPTTALDVTVQAQILALLSQRRRERGTAIVLITHDLGVVAGHADRVIVMYAGRIVEQAATDELFAAPRHPYTIGLLGSLARLDRRREGRLRPIPGQPPSLVDVPPGCAFHPRCPFATDRCRLETPALVGPSSHPAACHHTDAVVAARVTAT